LKKLTGMNRLLILILLLTSTITFGQDTSATRHKFFIGVSYSPDYCYRTQVNKSISDSLWNYVKNYYDSIETSKFGYTTGINLCYYISEKIFIESGVLYSNKGYKTIPVKTPMIDINGNVTYISASFISTYKYLDIPFKVNYTFLKRRIKIVAGIGATLNIFLNSSFTSEPKEAIESVIVISENTVNKINLSPTISIGLLYKLNEKMNLRLEPTYHYGIFNIDDNSSKSVHLWNAGIGIAYCYKL